MLGIFIDIETTGLDPLIHSPLEIAFQLIDLSDGTIFHSFNSLIFQTKEVWKKSDPESLKINGFTPESVAKSPNESEVAKKIIEIFDLHKINNDSSVFIAQNPSFDRSFFSQLIPPFDQNKRVWPYHWLDLASMYFSGLVHSLKKEKKPLPNKLLLSKNAIAESCHIPPEKSPHRAAQGVNHLISCYSQVIGFPLKPEKNNFG